MKKSGPQTCSYFLYVLETLSSFTGFISIKFWCCKQLCIFFFRKWSYVLYFLMSISTSTVLLCSIYIADILNLWLSFDFLCHFFGWIISLRTKYRICFWMSLLSSLCKLYFVICIFMWTLYACGLAFGYKRTGGLWLFSIQLISYLFLLVY